MSKEIEIKIEKFQKLIDDPRSSTEEIEKYTKVVETLKTKLPAKKEAKKEQKKGADKPKKKGVKVISSKRVSIDGKDVEVDSQEFCDYLTAQWKKRRSKASENKGKKKKTTSVMSRVSANIEKGIIQAVKSGIKENAAEIKKNPKTFIGKVEKLESSTKGFLQDLKEVMGQEYDGKEVTATVKSINTLIDELKKTMGEKK